VATHISRGDTLVLLADRHDVELGQRIQATVQQLRQQWQLLKQQADKKKALAKAYEDKLAQFRCTITEPV
jgi:adenosyl cobinamide kinase/adenosyl cobinamide phosphate guanylyltransferase